MHGGYGESCRRYGLRKGLEEGQLLLGRAREAVRRLRKVRSVRARKEIRHTDADPSATVHASDEQFTYG